MRPYRNERDDISEGVLDFQLEEQEDALEALRYETEYKEMLEAFGLRDLYDHEDRLDPYYDLEEEGSYYDLEDEEGSYYDLEDDYYLWHNPLGNYA